MKFPIHRAIQEEVLRRLPDSEAALEVPIGRRMADVLWFKERIIFEVQYSPISLSQSSKRTRDYRKMGYQVVWLLHCKNFNRSFVSAQEMYLRRNGAYYTDIMQNGSGTIFDQHESIVSNQRIWASEPFFVDISRPKFVRGRVSFKGDRSEYEDLKPKEKSDRLARIASWLS